MFAPATYQGPVQYLEQLGQFFVRLGAVLAGTREAQRVYNRLSMLSDSQLAARGLTRDDVTRLTLEALERPQR